VNPSRRRRRAIVLGLCGAGVLASRGALAQGERRRRVGIMWETSHAIVLQLFKKGMTELGWTEGRSVEYFERLAETTSPNLERLVHDLVDSHVDVLLLDDFVVGLALKVTSSVPMVCPNMTDPVAEGFTRSLSRPERNVTGVSWQSADSAAKRLQLGGEIVPGLRRACILFDAADPSARVDARQTAAAADRASIAVTSLELHDAEGVAAAFKQVKKVQPQLLILTASPLTYRLRTEIIRDATAMRVPVMSEVPAFVSEGAILSYGPDTDQTNHRGAYFVDRILNGARVADLPIEQPATFRLFLNLKAAHALGLTVPASIVQSATRVIQ
jgi:putative ABC transport system substrate-binding protein